MTRRLDSIYEVTNERVEELKNQILDIQDECSHEFGVEWQVYNIYSKRCKKCGHVHSVEY